MGIRVVGVAPGVLEATGLRTEEYERKLAYARRESIPELRATYEKARACPRAGCGRRECEQARVRLRRASRWAAARGCKRWPT